MENSDRADEQVRDPYVCDGCGCWFPAHIAEGVYDLECPHCDTALYVDD